ncbi:MAG: Methyltransferase type 11 [Fibrobacteria bacterium]|jgi:2-polyprenyl-3-methyl-5-hydroxy-6-metoxy-1,4-benzoquinol methylase|nr:Methyltransferase type 11 [Fibrobacteria bacterium]
MSISTTYPTHDKRPEMIPFLPRAFKRVLEIGCGEGAFAYNYSGAEERWGVELSASDSKKAMRFFDHVLNGTYDQVQDRIPDGYFDLVVCNDVIEHMEDHDWFLEAIQKKMTAEGRLVVSLPNIRYFKPFFEYVFLRDWRYRPNGNMDHSHLRFFTRKSLLRTLREHRFRVDKFGGINRAGKKFWSLPIVALMLLATLGYLSDTLYVQYAFSARKPLPSE